MKNVLQKNKEKIVIKAMFEKMHSTTQLFVIIRDPKKIDLYTKVSQSLNGCLLSKLNKQDCGKNEYDKKYNFLTKMLTRRFTESHLKNVTKFRTIVGLKKNGHASLKSFKQIQNIME